MGKDRSGKDRSGKEKQGTLVPPRLWAGEGDLCALAESVPAAVLVADATGALLFANPRLEALAEDAGALLDGAGWLEVLATEDRDGARRIWLDAAEARAPREGGLRLAAGAPVLCRVAPVFEGGHPVRWVISLSDRPDPTPALQAPASEPEARLHEVEDRLREAAAQLRAAEARIAEADADLLRLGARLEESEDRLRHALGAVDGLIYDWDLRRGLVRRDGAVEALLGVPPEDVPPTVGWWRERIHPDDLARIEAEGGGASGEGAGLVVADYRLRHRDGHWIDVLDRSVLRQVADGPARRVGSVVDLSALRSAERAWAASETCVHAILDAIPQPLWSASPDGRPDHRNRRWREVTGLPEDGAPAEDWTLALHPEDRPRARTGWADGLRTGLPAEAEVRLRQRDGSHRRVLSRARPIRDAAGTVLRWLVICTDIDEALENLRARGRGRAEVAEPHEERARSLDEPPRPLVPTPTVEVGGDARPESSSAPPAPEAASVNDLSREPAEPPAHPAPEGRSGDVREPADGKDDLATGNAPSGPADLDGLAARLRSPDLRDWLARWRAARGAQDEVPRFDAAGAALPDGLGGQPSQPAARIVVVEFGEAGEPPRLRTVQEWTASPLMGALAGALVYDKGNGSADPGASRRRVAAAAAGPARQYAEFRLGPGRCEFVERLRLPFSTDGRRIDRLVDLAVTGAAEEARLDDALAS